MWDSFRIVCAKDKCAVDPVPLSPFVQAAVSALDPCVDYRHTLGSQCECPNMGLTHFVMGPGLFEATS